MATTDVLCPGQGATFQIVEMNIPKVNEPRRRIVGVMNFQFEAARRETYTNWPSKNVSKEDLARDGFVYSHKTDQVKCFYCKGSIVCWDAGDVVHVEHKKSYKKCPFVNSQSAINIPLHGKQYERINQFIAERLDEADPPRRRNVYEADAKKTDDSAKPLSFSEYSNRSKRVASFERAPACLPSADKLADAGFFYSTFADLTQCYSCGGGVINWSPTENPKEVHDKLYPNCPLTDKSSQSSDSNLNPQGKRKRRLKAEDFKDDFLSFPWISTLRSMYSDEVIKDALAEDLETHLCMPYSVNQAIEVVDDYENSRH